MGCSSLVSHPSVPISGEPVESSEVFSNRVLHRPAKRSVLCPLFPILDRLGTYGLPYRMDGGKTRHPDRELACGGQ